MTKKHTYVHGGALHSLSLKSRAALALAVSLWIATGGVASAEEKTVTVESGETVQYVYNGAQSDTSPWTNPRPAGERTGYHTVINGGTATGRVFGGFSNDSNANNNTVTATNVTITADVVNGGYSGSGGTGNATGNIVTLTDTIVDRGDTSGSDVTGGSSSKGDATGNTVTLIRSIVSSYVIGGSVNDNHAATGNTVSLTDSTVGYYVYGGFGGDGNKLTGNTLNLSGENTAGPVRNFETVNLKSATWGKTVLKAESFDNVTNINASDLAFTNPGAASGSTTLLSATSGLDTPTLTDTSHTQNYTDAPLVAGVTIDGTLTGTVAKSASAVTYTLASNTVNKIAFGDVAWQDSGALYTRPDTISFAGAAVDTSNFRFTNPEAVTGSMTLIANAGNMSATANAVSQSYVLNPVAGLSIDAALNGSVAFSGNDLTYSVTSNNATKLTFGDVEWKDSGALLDHATTLSHVSFNGADVDTANINFTNISELDANKKMTLVSSFGDTVGTITGTKYKVGSTLEGEGKASLSGNDLIFTAETGTETTPTPTPDEKKESGGLHVQEQTHNTVMGATVGMAALSAGNEFIGAATEGLALASNVGADGVSSFAQVGGGTMRQETGSHVDTHTWNAILALGRKNEKERGTFEYGAFFEYGSGNYTTHNGDERGDGSTHYTGGGLLAKWTQKHGFYVEGSLRAGTVHDDARNVLRDALGNPYSYETNANYFGGHIGAGKEFTLNNGNMVDVYGKYFVNRRNGVSFNAGGHYDLDAVTSQVLRVGARYTVKGKKWNFYAGAAYEHEFDGKAGGTADGLAIRGADTSGGSFRGELGATVKPDKNGPLTLDFNVTGFAGKKQGITGGVSVALMF